MDGDGGQRVELERLAEVAPSSACRGRWTAGSVFVRSVRAYVLVIFVSTNLDRGVNYIQNQKTKAIWIKKILRENERSRSYSRLPFSKSYYLNMP